MCRLWAADRFCGEEDKELERESFTGAGGRDVGGILWVAVPMHSKFLSKIRLVAWLSEIRVSSMMRHSSFHVIFFFTLVTLLFSFLYFFQLFILLNAVLRAVPVDKVNNVF